MFPRSISAAKSTLWKANKSLPKVFGMVMMTRPASSFSLFQKTTTKKFQHLHLSYSQNFPFSSQKTTCQKTCLEDLSLLESKLTKDEILFCEESFKKFANCQDFSQILPKEADQIREALFLFAKTLAYRGDPQKAFIYFQENVFFFKATGGYETVNYLEIIYLLMELNRLQGSEPWLEKAINAFSNDSIKFPGDPKLKELEAGLLIAKLFVFKHLERYNEAIICAEQAFSVLEKESYDLGERFLPRINFELAQIYFALNEVKKAVNCCEKCAEFASLVRNTTEYKTFAELYLNLGLLLVHNRQWNEGVKFVTKANDLLKKMQQPDDFLIMRYENILGQAYSEIDMEKAENHLLKALEILENKFPHEKMYRTHTYLALAKIYSEKKNDKVKEMVEKSTEAQIALSQKTEHELFNIYYQSFNLLKTNPSFYEDAIRYLDKVDEYNKSEDAQGMFHKSTLLLNKAELLIELKQNTQAHLLIEQAEKILKNFDHTQATILNLYNLYLLRGRLFLRTGDFNKSLDDLLKAKTIAGDNLNLQESVYQPLSVVYEELNQIDKAEDSHASLVQIVEKTHGEISFSRLQKMQDFLNFLWRNGRREKAIELLEKQGGSDPKYENIMNFLKTYPKEGQEQNQSK